MARVSDYQRHNEKIITDMSREKRKEHYRKQITKLKKIYAKVFDELLEEVKKGESDRTVFLRRCEYRLDDYETKLRSACNEILGDPCGKNKCAFCMYYKNNECDFKRNKRENGRFIGFRKAV